MPDVLDKSGKVVGRYDYTPEGRKRAKAHADKIGGTVKKKFTDTHPHGAYRMTRSTGLKTIKPEKKKLYKKILKKKAPKLRPQPEWEVSDFQWVPDPDKAGSLKLRYTEGGVKKKRKIATHKAKTEGKKGFPYRPTHKIEKEKNP